MTGEPAPGPSVSHRRILKIAIPVVLSNATVPILGAVDTGVVGQMGEAAPIAAVGAGAIVLTSVYWMFGFLRMGTTGLVAQALGAGDQREVVALLSRAGIIAVSAGLVMILGQALLFAAAFAIAPLSEQVQDLARSYMEIRIWSSPAAIAIYGLTGWLIAHERTAAVLAIQLVMNGVNIVLDIWFVLALGWGVQGVAIATFLAEWSGLFLGLWCCRKAFSGSTWLDRTIVLDPARLRQMLAVNGDILIRTLLLQATMTSFLLIGGRFGTVTLAANQILLQFLYITSYALDGFAFAVEVLVGRSFGAGDRAQVRRMSIMCAGWGVATACVLALGFGLFGSWIVDLMATSEEVRSTARVHLPWMVAVPMIGVGAWILDGIFIGATRTRDMRNMMVVSFLAYGLALAVLMPAFGNHGLWGALIVSFIMRGLTLGARYPALERAAVGRLTP